MAIDFTDEQLSRPKRRRLSEWDHKYSGYAYVAPFFIIFAVFGLFPIIWTAWVSLREMSPLDGIWGGVSVGFDNFHRLLFEDPRFWNAVRNTLSIWIISTVPQLLAALGLAHILNERRLKGKTFWRMSMLVPNITSVVAVAIIFSSIFGRDYGIANWILESLGFSRIEWVAGVASSHIAIAMMVMWRWTGYNSLIYLAGMQSIPKDLYESATIDGATRWRQFVHVTIPQLRPTIIFTVIISTIGGMQIFAEPLILGGQAAGTAGGSARQFQTLTLFLYEQGFREFRFGYASAIAWLLFMFIVILAIVNYLISRRIATS
ncbi:MAG: sugar ABC transporter permease [bacterium]|nr:sugar ABC transporter permease [bacterium]